MASPEEALMANGDTSRKQVRHALRLASAPPSDEARQPRSLERLVNDAAAQITRLSAPEAFSASQTDGVLIDIRSHDARERHGVIPGSLHIPRTVLEWRIALDSPWRNPHLAGVDQRLILICDHGYSSILAASNLVKLGFHRAADVIGGYESWKANRLRTAPCPEGGSAAGVLPGTDPPL